MPIFEMDDGRARLLQPMQPLASSFVTELRGLLDEHLAVVVGEPLFPVRSRAVLPDHTDGPEVLALDAAGNPVLVEAAQVVDDDTLVAVLRHAGTAARLTATDLARAYHADPTRFAVDYAGFREQVVFHPSTGDRPHVRVVLLCAEVGAETADALAALRAADARLTVLQVGVMRGSDDRRLLDVSPLALHETARRPVEPTALRLVRAAGLRDERPAATAPVPAPSVPPMSASPMSAPRMPAATTPVPMPTPMPMPMPMAPSLPDPAPEPVMPTRVASHRAATDPTNIDLSFAADPPPAQSTRLRSGAPSTYVPVEPPEPLVEAPPDLLPATMPRTSLPSYGSRLTPPAGMPTSEPGPVDGRLGGGVPAQHGPGQATDRQWPMPELTSLAKRRQAVTLLVWVRERRGQRFEAMLRADGLIQLPDGSVFADPDLAAARAAGVEGPVDGWRAWHLGAGGPTLADASGR